MHLIICEKQAAARRIASILGNGRFSEEKKYGVPYYVFPEHIIAGLSGHVLKVDFPPNYSSWSKTKLSDLIKAPLVYAPDRKNIINLIKHLAKKSTDIIIATDYDTEGESIGYEVVRILGVPVRRMRFSSITEEEIMKSYNNLSELDVNLAMSADARREIDLIWGAVLTRFLSLAAKRLGNSYLSAGRVQSPTLSLIVKREKERLSFVPVPYSEFVLHLDGFDAFSKKVFDRKLRKEILESTPSEARVISVKSKEVTTPPPSPFDTTSFLREAASLGLSGVNAMRVAESLYLKGLISYPRTDNQVYPKSLDAGKILKSFEGTEYEGLLKFTRKDLKPTRGKKETKDHPPIHPTGVRAQGIDGQEKKVYDLIVRRFISTFSEDSVEKIVQVKLDAGEEFSSKGLRIIRKGWRAVYNSLNKEIILPKLRKGDVIPVKSVECVDKETQPPNRYGHGSIIKVMNELNLGTKSTRPSIIQKLMSRYYIFYSRSFEPTPLAMAVMDALSSYAGMITEPEMTRRLEEDMEKISLGKVSKEDVVNESREMLEKVLVQLEKNKEKISQLIREGILASRVVGKCPKCGNDLVIINARHRFVGCKGYPSCRNSYPLPRHGFIQVTNEVCRYCGLKKIVLLGNKPFKFCSNIDCPSRDNDEETLKLRALRDNYLNSLK